VDNDQRPLLRCPAGARPLIAPIPARRLPALALECAIERVLRFVSDFGRDLGYASRGAMQGSRCQHQPPSGEISHRRLRKISRKALHQCGPRNSHLIGERRDRPWICHAAVHIVERFGQAGVPKENISMVKDTYYFTSPDKSPAECTLIPATFMRVTVTA
jgi:hypothetical protein